MGPSSIFLRLCHLLGQNVLRLLVLLPHHRHAGVAGVVVHLHELGDVELRFLQDLHLAHQHVLQGEDALRLPLDLLADGLGDELLHEVLQGHLPSLRGHDVDHLLADLPDLRRLRVAVRLDLVLQAPGEREHEESHLVAVRGLHVHVRLDQRGPLPDQGVELVPREVHAVEVREAVPPLHLVDAQLDLLVGLVLVVVEVGQVHFQDAALQRLRGDLGARRLGDEGLPAVADREHARRLDVVPLLLQEGVAHLLLAALPAALGEPLVLAHGHPGSEAGGRGGRGVA
mmetsp:Transcript_48883/g.138133  ORF Transcript_48883/g.138133 Transcript_48883/m.138133 type:complete len:285 (-) Transcript_48883:51-905(-)